MVWKLGIVFLLLSFIETARAADSIPATDAMPVSGSEKGNGKGKKPNKPAERLDLNQVDLEQVEEDWESTPAKPMVDVGRSIKIREIVEPSGEYSYASFGRPDPFMQPEISLDPAMGQGFNPMSSELAITSPLQRYPLSDLNIKGVWQLSSGQTRAVVLTPKNEGVVVQEGDPISSGKVLSIKRDQLVARLYRLRSDGVREYEDVTMKIGISKAAEKAVIKLEAGKDPMVIDPNSSTPGALVPLSQVMANPQLVPPQGLVIPPQAFPGLVVPPPSGAVPMATGGGGLAPVRTGADGAPLNLVNPEVQPVKGPAN
jgi:Tfp pilus assembly protein PilP